MLPKTGTDASGSHNDQTNCETQVAAINGLLGGTMFNCATNDWITQGYYISHDVCTSGGTQESSADIITLNDWLDSAGKSPELLFV